MTNNLIAGNPAETVPCFALSKNDSYVMSASGGRISLFNMMTFKVILEWNYQLLTIVKVKLLVKEFLHLFYALKVLFQERQPSSMVLKNCIVCCIKNYRSAEKTLFPFEWFTEKKYRIFINHFRFLLGNYRRWQLSCLHHLWQHILLFTLKTTI